MRRNPEQVGFYKSKQWKATRAAYLERVNHICERCGAPAKIVHHRHYIDAANVTDPRVTLDHANLEALCQRCHNQEHHANDSCEPGLTFDGRGDLVSTRTSGHRQSERGV